MSAGSLRHQFDPSSNPRPADGTTRRGLVAAAVALTAAVATKKAFAFDRPPRDGGGTQCFLLGTQIRTPGGEVTVENLAVGDLVTTLDGTAKPIKWIGRRRVERDLEARWPADALPIKVAASAFAELVPHTDLYLSPTHALFLDGLLVPVRTLVNGRSIVQCSSFDANAIEYFHIELAGHDVIFAEGAAAETLLATADRAFDSWEGEASVGAEEFAPRVSATNAAVIWSRLRSAASPLIDRRQRGDIIWDRVAQRAETELAA